MRRIYTVLANPTHECQVKARAPFTNTPASPSHFVLPLSISYLFLLSRTLRREAAQAPPTSPILQPALQQQEQQRRQDGLAQLKPEHLQQQRQPLERGTGAETVEQLQQREEQPHQRPHHLGAAGQPPHDQLQALRSDAVRQRTTRQ